VWFHLLSVACLLTRSPFLRKVLVLQGAGICLGWYAAIANDYYAEGTFCHTLYRNMPASMLEHMVREHEDGYVMLDTQYTRAAKALSHVLDTLGHPGLLCLFWRLHRRSGGTLRDVLTWPVIVFAWHLSRVWSLVHSYHNTGAPSLWYYGHDVYLLNNLDSYLMAYIAEGVCFAGAIVCRVYWDRDQGKPASISGSHVEEREYYESLSGKGRDDAKTPFLIHSESAVSTSSMM